MTGFEVGRVAPRAPWLVRTSDNRIHPNTKAGKMALVPLKPFLQIRTCPPIRGARGATRPTA